MEIDHKGKPSVAAILLAAGSSTRMGEASRGGNKVLLEIGGEPILLQSLRTILAVTEINKVVLVHRKSDGGTVQEILAQVPGQERVCAVAGGKERFDSVYNGLNILSESPPGIVAIHDSARPFTTERIFRETIEQARKHGAATVAISLSDTLKREEDGFLIETLPRAEHYRVQTPQAFRFDLIWEAHQHFRINPSSKITDDCMLLEREGHKIALVEGDERNIKITTQFDLEVAEMIARTL